MAVSFYSILGVDPVASTQDIRQAFKNRALLVHPDKGGTDTQFQDVMEAFEILGDKVRRAQYDRDLAGQAQKAKRSRMPEEVPAPFIEKRRKTRHVSNRRNSRSEKTSSKNFHMSEVRNDQSGSQKFVGKARSRYRNDPVQQLHNLLQHLPANQRRGVLLHKFSEAQRLALEQWILAHRMSSPLAPSSISPSLPQASSQQKSLGWKRGNQLSMQQLKHQKQWQPSRTTPTGKHKDHHASSHITMNLKASTCVPCGPCLYHLCRENERKENRGNGELCDAHAASQCHRIAPKDIPGITSRIRQGQGWYCAKANIKTLRLVTKEVRDLSLAIDFLVSLSGIKRTITHAMETLRIQSRVMSDSHSRLFELCVRDAVLALFSAPGPSKDLGLRLAVCIPAQRWIGTELMTPWFHVPRDLERCLAAWRILQEARGPVLWGGRTFNLYNPEEFQASWTRIRAAFLNVVEDSGNDVATSRARLDAREAAHRPRQQQAMERWNQSAMAYEERQQRSAMQAEKRQEARERRGMARAELVARMQLRANQRKERSQHFCERRIDLWLRRWSQRSEEQARAQERKRHLKVRRMHRKII